MGTEQEYLRDPVAIERHSQEIARQQCDLSAFSQQEAELVLRIVQSCADVTLAKEVRFVCDPIAAGLRALRRRTSVLCDVEMVKCALLSAAPKEPLCFIKDQAVRELARSRGHTRAMEAVSKWLPRLPGAVVVIGNAPTALFRLLELLRNGSPQPALVIAMPLGFVGAAEAKEALLRDARKWRLPCITLTGLRGGSAPAAATYRALAQLARRDLP